MLEIKLFGAGEANLNGERVGGFPQQQAGLLLCYLLLNRGRPQPRERLAAIFWEQHNSATARKYLRNAIWRLRRMLGEDQSQKHPFLNILDTSISFCWESDYRLDTELLEAHTRPAKSVPGEALSGEQAEALEKAVRVYSGDLLEGVYDDWTLYERERLRLLYLSSLNKLMVYYGTHGKPARGLVHGERILSLDPAREKIHRQIMWLYWLSGDRAAALGQYKRCKQVLREELGLSPMKETRELYAAIKNNETPEGFDTAGALDAPVQAVIPADALKKLAHLQKLADSINAELESLAALLNQRVVNK